MIAFDITPIVQYCGACGGWHIFGPSSVDAVGVDPLERWIGDPHTYYCQENAQAEAIRLFGRRALLAAEWIDVNGENRIDPLPEGVA